MQSGSTPAKSSRVPDLVSFLLATRSSRYRRSALGVVIRRCRSQRVSSASDSRIPPAARDTHRRTRDLDGGEPDEWHGRHAGRVHGVGGGGVFTRPTDGAADPAVADDAVVCRLSGDGPGDVRRAARRGLPPGRVRAGTGRRRPAPTGPRAVRDRRLPRDARRDAGGTGDRRGGLSRSRRAADAAGPHAVGLRGRRGVRGHRPGRTGGEPARWRTLAGRRPPHRRATHRTVGRRARRLGHGREVSPAGYDPVRAQTRPESRCRGVGRARSRTDRAGRRRRALRTRSRLW